MNICDLPVHELWIKQANHNNPALRNEIETFIAERFKEEYDANVQHFADHLLGLRDSRGNIRIAAGYNLASKRTLFLEQYLPTNIETTLKIKTGQSIDRTRIIEVGNLASKTLGGTRIMIHALSEIFESLKPEMICMTANAKVRNTLNLMHLEHIELEKAEETRWKAPGKWGSYYSQGKPIVIAIPYKPI